MSSDIHIILQLLQRQLSQVPPAYSPISPSSHSLAMYGIVPRSLEPLAPCAPLQDQELPTQEQVRSPLLAQPPPASFSPEFSPGKAQPHTDGSRQSHGVLPWEQICPVHHWFWGTAAIPNTARLPISGEGSGFLCSEAFSNEK